MSNHQPLTLKDPFTRLDEQFSVAVLQIQKYSCVFDKNKRSKVDQWIKKLGQNSSNLDFKQDRNLYSMLLLDSILSCQLMDPFDKSPPEGPLPSLNRNLVVNHIIFIFFANLCLKKFRLADLHKKLQEPGSNITLIPKVKARATNTMLTTTHFSNKK